MTSVAIIGAGIGGLCTAISLQLKGYDVHIYEKTDRAGGVLKSLTSPDGAYRFEESASIPINPLTYHKFFDRLGLKAESFFCEKSLETLYNVYYTDGRVLSIPHSIRDMKALVKDNFKEDVKGYDDFLAATTKKYRLAKKYFLNRPFMKASSVVNGKLLSGLIKLNPSSSASSYVKRYIKSKKLRDFILFQAFFMGVSPDRLPNVYTTVYSNSQVEGISHIKGGLSHYAKVLTCLFLSSAGKIYYNSPVGQILKQDTAVTGIRIGDKTINYDLVVVNADYCYAQKVLLDRELHRYKTLSCSTFIIHLGLTKQYPTLNVHNLYINEDLEAEVSNLFKGKLPNHPSLYIYSPSIIDDSYCKNPTHSVINIMVRVPNLRDLPISWSEDLIKALSDRCLATVSTIKGLEDLPDHIAYKSYTTPLQFQNQYNCRYGSCFGIGHTLLQSMALRPQLRDKQYSNLYYVGSSIHPGNGASIVINGSQLVSAEICKNHPISFDDSENRSE